jgi:hypothetical protein
LFYYYFLSFILSFLLSEFSFIHSLFIWF